MFSVPVQPGMRRGKMKEADDDPMERWMDASIDKYIEGWKLRLYHEETNRDFMGTING